MSLTVISLWTLLRIFTQHCCCASKLDCISFLCLFFILCSLVFRGLIILKTSVCKCNVAAWDKATCLRWNLEKFPVWQTSINLRSKSSSGLLVVNQMGIKGRYLTLCAILWFRRKSWNCSASVRHRIFPQT